MEKLGGIYCVIEIDRNRYSTQQTLFAVIWYKKRARDIRTQSRVVTDMARLGVVP